jgi:DNA-binding LytR/AlgR family response regulator
MKIAIVEDELIIATNIWRKLISVGYEAFPPCSSFNEAIELLKSEKPDIILIDIRIKGLRDGIELAEHIRKNHDMPIIFVTANGDASTIERAKKARPNAYIVKPFTKQDLHAAIEIATLNFEMMTRDTKQPVSRFLIVKVSHDFVKIVCDDILFLRSEGNYVNVVLKEQKTRNFRSTLAVLQNQLDPEIFLRISKSFVVNFRYVEELESDRVKIAGEFLPTSKLYRSYDEMVEAFGRNS